MNYFAYDGVLPSFEPYPHISLNGFFQFASNDDEYQIESVIEELKMIV